MRLAIWWTGWVAIAATARGVCRLTWQWNIWLRSHITIYYGARKTVVQGSPPRNCLLVSCRRWPVNWASQATTFGEIKRRSACDSPIQVPSARRSGEHHVAVPAGHSSQSRTRPRASRKWPVPRGPRQATRRRREGCAPHARPAPRHRRGPHRDCTARARPGTRPSRPAPPERPSDFRIGIPPSSTREVRWRHTGCRPGPCPNGARPDPWEPRVGNCPWPPGQPTDLRCCRGYRHGRDQVRVGPMKAEPAATIDSTSMSAGTSSRRW